MLCKRGVCRHAVSVRPPRSYILSKRVIVSSKFFSPSGSHTILVFPHQTSWRYSDGDPLNGVVECRWGKQKSRFWANIMAPSRAVNAATVKCYPDRGKLWHIAGSKRRSLLMAGDHDVMFTTRSLNVRPKTTEQHLIVCSDKSVAHVTNNKKTALDVLYYWS